MERIEERIDAFEELVFNGRDADSRAFAEDLRDIHVLKRQVTLDQAAALAHAGRGAAA